MMVSAGSLAVERKAHRQQRLGRVGARGIAGQDPPLARTSFSTISLLTARSLPVGAWPTTRHCDPSFHP
jgi:hypothetical protein